MWETFLRKELEKEEYQLVMRDNGFLVSPGIIKGKADLEVSLSTRQNKWVEAHFKWIDSYEADIGFFKELLGEDNPFIDFDVSTMTLVEEIDNKKESSEIDTSLPENVKKAIIQAIETIAKEKEVLAVAIEDGYFDDILEKEGYKGKLSLPKEEVSFFRSLDYKQMVKILEPETIHLIHQMDELIPSFFEKMQEKDITFTWSTVSNYIEEDTDKVIRRHRYYYEGHEGMLNWFNEGKKIVLKDKDQKNEFVVQTKENVFNACEEIMKKTYNNRRLRNLTDPPRKHFDDAFKWMNEKYRNSIHQQLLSFTNYREIEGLSITARKDIEVKEIDEMGFINFKKYFIVYDNYNPNTIKIFKEKEQAKNYLFEQLTKLIKKEVDRL